MGDDDKIIMIEVSTVSPKQLRRQQSISMNNANSIKYSTSVTYKNSKPQNTKLQNSKSHSLLKRKSGRQTVPNKITNITSKLQTLANPNNYVSDDEFLDVFYP